MEQYVTVVFKINDLEKWKAEFDKIYETMTGDDSLPWRATGISLDDEMHRLELMEQAISSYTYKAVELCEKILGASDVWKRKLHDF